MPSYFLPSPKDELGYMTREGLFRKNSNDGEMVIAISKIDEKNCGFNP